MRSETTPAMISHANHSGNAYTNTTRARTHLPMWAVTKHANAVRDRACQCGPRPRIPLWYRITHANAVQNRTCQCGPRPRIPMRAGTKHVNAVHDRMPMRPGNSHANAVRECACQSGSCWSQRDVSCWIYRQSTCGSLTIARSDDLRAGNPRSLCSVHRATRYDPLALHGCSSFLLMPGTTSRNSST